MTELKPFLKHLLSLPGLSGYEDPVREVIADAWRPLVDELSVSRLGSLHGLKRGDGSTPRHSILLSAHMDAIGLMATTIKDGFIHFTEVGGVDPRILPGSPVLVHTRTGDLPGVVVLPSDRLVKPSAQGKPAPLSGLLVDIGLEPDEVQQRVKPGDLISFATPPIELAGDVISGHTLDNRASVAALTVALDELQRLRHNWDVWMVASVQEEETLGGALTSPFEIKPDAAIAVDVTFAKGPGASDFFTYPLGKTVPIGWGPNIHPGIYKALEKTAKDLEMDYEKDVMPTMSGTDAMGIQIIAGGIPTGVVSIPLRYMHTPVESVAYADIERCGRLLANFVARLTPDFVDTLTAELKS
jgi:endoglucanase